MNVWQHTPRPRSTTRRNLAIHRALLTIGTVVIAVTFAHLALGSALELTALDVRHFCGAC